MKVTQVVVLLLAVVVGFGITLWFVWGRGEPIVFGAFEGEQPNDRVTPALLSALYGFAVTIVGVVLGVAYRHLAMLREGGTTSVNPLRLAKDVARSVDLYLGLTSAPIVYGLLLQSLGDPSWPGLTVIALQNGFVASAIISQFVTDQKPANP